MSLGLIHYKWNKINHVTSVFYYCTDVGDVKYKDTADITVAKLIMPKCSNTLLWHGPSSDD